MAFTVEIKNLGKIAGAPIAVGGLTVLAGANATGKSFFSKALYSVFDAMNANHALMHIQGLMEPLQTGRRELGLEVEYAGFKPDSLETCLKRLEGMCESLRGEKDEFAATREIHGDLVKVAREAVRVYGELRGALVDGLVKDEYHPFDDLSLKGMDAGIENLTELARRSPEDIVLNGFRRTLRQNLIGNFQVPTLSELKGSAEADLSIAIKGVGDISIVGGDLVTNIHREGLMRLREYSRVIYLESPLYWKLRSALKGAFPRFLPLGGRRGLGVPKYFTDLDSALGEEYSGDVAFPSLLQRLKEDVIGGKITLDESGRMVFHEAGKGRSFSLPLTATGAVNLGILALLIERKIIDKGAFLFIDEPESNLHPKWHVEMTRALFELARGGVNVVIATHSPDIMERLSALVKKNPDLEEMVTLNHFSRDGVKNGGKNFGEKMDDIQRDLTDAFSGSYMENVR